MLKIGTRRSCWAASTLAIVGTFLVRSGVLNSIHAFGASTLGVPFVILITAMVTGSIYLVVSRREVLRSEHQLDSLFRVEAASCSTTCCWSPDVRDLLGHVLPAHLRRAHRTKARSVRHGSIATRCRLR